MSDFEYPYSEEKKEFIWKLDAKLEKTFHRLLAEELWPDKEILGKDGLGK